MLQTERMKHRLLRGLREGDEIAVSFCMKSLNQDLNALYKIRPMWFHMFDPIFDEVEDLSDQRRNKLIGLFYGLAEGKKINVNTQDVFGNTALHLLTQAGEGVFARILVEAGADMNILNDREETPFSLAVFAGNYDLATHFFDTGKVKVPSTLLPQLASLVDQQSVEMRPETALSFLKQYVGMDMEGPKDAFGVSYAEHMRQVARQFKRKGVQNESVR